MLQQAAALARGLDLRVADIWVATQLRLAGLNATVVADMRTWADPDGRLFAGASAAHHAARAQQHGAVASNSRVDTAR